MNDPGDITNASPTQLMSLEDRLIAASKKPYATRCAHCADLRRQLDAAERRVADLTLKSRGKP